MEAGPGAACEIFRLCAENPCVGPVLPQGGRPSDAAGPHPAWHCARSRTKQYRAGRLRALPRSINTALDPARARIVCGVSKSS